MNNSFIITKVSKDDLNSAKELIKKYLAWIDINLSFQEIDEEISSFPAKYNEPSGSFFIAKYGESVIGCVGLRKLETGICEMKRLFVKDEYKGKGIGSRLIQTAVEEARKKGYKKIRLDTLPKMKSAQKLYKEYGFYQIDPYTVNPVQGSVFMEKILIDINK